AIRAYHSYPNNMGTWTGFTGGRFDGPAYQLGQTTRGALVTLATVLDGTSNTVLFSEVIRGINSTAGSPGGREYIFRGTLSAAGTYTITDLAADCQASTTIADTSKGAEWLNQNTARGGGYSHIMTPNKKACFWSDASASKFQTIIGASSNHPGGVNVGLLDGSVRFVKETVAPTTWRAISTRAGGETVSADSY